ncbi:hypothetical protein ADK65_05360, partial [Streptomyces sp. NRRL B-1140]
MQVAGPDLAGGGGRGQQRLFGERVHLSVELRRSYHAGEASYEEFAERYEAEVSSDEASAALDGVRELAREGDVTLLTASKTPER